MWVAAAATLISCKGRKKTGLPDGKAWQAAGRLGVQPTGLPYCVGPLSPGGQVGEARGLKAGAACGRAGGSCPSRERAQPLCVRGWLPQSDPRAGELRKATLPPLPLQPAFAAVGAAAAGCCGRDSPLLLCCERVTAHDRRRHRPVMYTR
jgi:hypothetical protein